MRLKGDDIPDDWRQMKAASDGDMETMEKELSLNCPNDLDDCLFFANNKTFIKWFQSVEESEPDWIRVKEGDITAVAGKIPKGIVKLQGKSRQSQTPSQMVSYGSHKN